MSCPVFALLVMPGLDPGIHTDVLRALKVRMDCRVKPGNDGEGVRTPA